MKNIGQLKDLFIGKICKEFERALPSYRRNEIQLSYPHYFSWCLLEVPIRTHYTSLGLQLPSFSLDLIVVKRPQKQQKLSVREQWRGYMASSGACVSFCP